MPTLVIRADANTAIGSGHVMRCLALAQAWQDQGGAVTFVSDMSALMRERLKSELISVRSVTAKLGSEADAEHLIETAWELDAQHVVVDGYHFGAAYQKQLKDARLRVLFVDDNGHAEHYFADLVLNQNIHASEDLYLSREPNTHLLLGTRYTLLRREFQAWQDWQRDIPNRARKVLVTMGGSDPDNVTLKVIRALEQVTHEKLEVKVVVGGGNPYLAELKAVAEHSPHSIRLERDVSDMPALMAWADVAVSAGGSTCWELAFLELPGAIIVLAENQRAVAEHLADQNVVVNLGWHAHLAAKTVAAQLTDLLVNAEQRRVMAARGRELVDSRGGERVVKALRQSPLSLRPVGPQDRELLWRWANDPVVRQSAFNTEPIAWNDHVCWFDQKLGDKNTVIFIAEQAADSAVGQVRFQIRDREAEISISVDVEFRGRGYGRYMLQQALDAVAEVRYLTRVNAYIKPENSVSRKLFDRAGFYETGITVYNGKPAIHATISIRDLECQEDSEND